MSIELIPEAGNSVAQAATVSHGLVTLDSSAASTPVSISGLVQVQNPVPAAGEFFVDYQIGVLRFNAAQEGASVTVTYQPATASGVTVAKANEIIDSVNELLASDPDLIITTKGDMIAGNAGGDAARLAVGANGKVLMADSTQALGVKWETPASDATTASNVGTAGVGVFKQKTGVDLEFKKINAGSAKVTVTDDVANSEVDIDVAEAALTLNNLGGTLGIAKGGTGQVTQTAAMDALSPTTTKGDLLVDNGTNVVRVPVGANDQVLTADSAQAAGVKWATPSAGMTNPMDTLGDIITGGVAGAPTKLPIGTDGNVLTVAAGVPSWNAPPFVNIPQPFQYDESFVYDAALGNDVFIFVEGGGYNAIGIMGAAIGSDDLLTITAVPVQSIGRVAHPSAGVLVTARIDGFNLRVKIPAAVSGLVNGNTYRVALLTLRVVPG